MANFYFGSTAVITTKHEKDILLAPAFREVGIELQLANLDTDQLGTFSGEIKRIDSQRETAVKKARLGMQSTGIKIGLASEGSIGADPLVPLLFSNIECLAWVDDLLGFDLVEFYRSFEIKTFYAEFSSDDSIDALMDSIQASNDLSRNALIVRTKDPADSVIKGINDIRKLRSAILSISKTFDFAVIESDFRAHFSESRRNNISRCANRLIARLKSNCPTCDIPGFGHKRFTVGLPCQYCGQEVTNFVSGEVIGCVKCGYEIEKSNGLTEADPGSCKDCNP